MRNAPDKLERWLETERDQLPLWLPVAMGAGVAAWFLLPGWTDWAAFLLAACGIGGLALATAQGGRLVHALGVAALAAALGCALVWSKSERVGVAPLARPVVATFDARVEAVDRLPARAMVRLRLAPLGQPALPVRVRVNIATDKFVEGVTPGAMVAVRARLLGPAPPAVPGAYDFAQVAWFQGLGATGKALDPVRIVTPGSIGGPAALLARWRAALTLHIQRQVAGAPGGVAAAFVTGDVGAIPQDDNDAMRRAGLAHLLSISGLHVTAVIAATMLLAMRLLALSPGLALRWPLPLIAAGAGAVAGIAYTLLSGAEVPTVRSCVASLLVLGGLALGREALTLRLVATGALIVMLFWPEALAGPSFQLSFAAVTAIIALHEHPWVRDVTLAAQQAGRARRIGFELLSLLATGLLVEAALAPIAVYHFHRSGLYGAFANIVAIPLSTFVIMPLEAGALLLDIAGIGAPLWWLAGKALALLLWIAHAVAAMPGAAMALPSMPDGAFALMVAGGLWLALWRTKARRLGLAPLVAGAAWAFATPAPDLLVTGDGKHLALRAPDGRLALLRPRAGDYTRGLLAETSGIQSEALDLDALPGATCGPDSCLAAMKAGGRTYRILATRSAYAVDRDDMARACAGADIVVSDRFLPRACRPRWLKADRSLLSRTGGLAIVLSSGEVRTVAQENPGHPWSVVSSSASGSASRRRARRASAGTSAPPSARGSSGSIANSPSSSPAPG